MTFCAGAPSARADNSATQPLNLNRLNVGDAPPPIQVGTWFKGTAVNRFEKGRVYVVEFWATWCGPCKRTIPHLSELARQYAGKVDVVGISVSEQPDEPTDQGIAKVVRPFVEQMGSKMDYAVAADGIDGFMSSHWMTAAGVESIPTAFVIDRETRIAWIGNAALLEDVLSQVVAGTWNTAKAASDAAVASDQQAHARTLVAPISAAIRKRDFAGALDALHHAVAEDPALASNPDVMAMHLFADVNTNGKEAVTYIQSITTEDGPLTTQPSVTGVILKALPLEQQCELLRPEEWKTIGEALKPLLLMNSKNFVAASAYGDILLNAGDLTSAIHYKQNAIDIATTQPANSALNNWISAQQQSLRKMQHQVK